MNEREPAGSKTSTSDVGQTSTAEVAPSPTDGHEATSGGMAPTVAVTGSAGTAPASDPTIADGPAWPPPRVPRFLGEYEIEGVMAQGGMGVVYRARQVKLNNRPVALKLIRDPALARPSDIRRFLAEAAVVAELDHPTIVPICQVDQVDGQPFFSMRLIEGGTSPGTSTPSRPTPGAPRP